MTTNNEALADALVTLFEAVGPGDEATVDALHSHYHPDVLFTDPIQRAEGRDAFLDANRRLVRRTRVLSFTMHDRATTPDHIFLTWTMRLAMKLGPLLEETGVTHLKVRNGLVVEHRDHWDLTAFLTSALPGGRRLIRTAFKPFL
ncbi:MAG: nuclear transport factor 2 family protein [Myxococcota bacterium]